MTKIKKLVAGILSGIRASTKWGAYAFCNIAEGTHSGSITMVAAAAVDAAYLVLKAGENENETLAAGAADKPLGFSLDEAAEGEPIPVGLPGSTESTYIATAASDVSAGDSLYTAAGGKVSKIAVNGSYKVGVALCSASTGGRVEIDPQGFGESAWQFYACGVHTWTGSGASNALSLPGMGAEDVAIASVLASGGSEKNVKTSVSADGLTFNLDAAGVEGATKITWMAIRKS